MSSQHSHGHDEGSGSSTVRAAEKAYQSEMMFVGEKCHLSECRRDSFLPFRCRDCQHEFCSDHYKTGDHRCSKASASFLVPLCPLCHEPPKNWKRDEDPNIAMNAHLSPHWKTGKIECEAIDVQGVVRDDAKGKQPREKRTNECKEKKCRKIMIVPIQCPSCHLQFCPSHRAPVQHDCTSVNRRAPLTSSSNTVRSPIPNASSLATKASALGNPTARTSEKKEEKELSVNLNPLQAISTAHKGLKMDKRARSEHTSAIKAMQARHAKGLLTPAEQVRLAEEMAITQRAKEHERDCVIA
ncbi:hypothetical protein CBS101457_004439 [Exobasidium rhododendri]|nr:hypothetical protein CBS101457_004439 [Exobasidium rhododendri]